MKYQIDISGMHCMGCVNLIKMSFEDEGLKNVVVQMHPDFATFESDDDAQKITELLSKIFSEFKEYKYFNLKEV